MPFVLKLSANFFSLCLASCLPSSSVDGDEHSSGSALHWEMLVYNDISKNAWSAYILIDPYFQCCLDITELRANSMQNLMFESII